MPIPQTIRVNPLDLRKNIAIGVSLPFKGPFKSTFTTKDQIKSNLINLLLTNKGERVMIPEIQLLNVVVSPDIDSNSISITIDYKIIISNTPGQVTIQFETIR